MKITKDNCLIKSSGDLKMRKMSLTLVCLFSLCLCASCAEMPNETELLTSPPVTTGGEPSDDMPSAEPSVEPSPSPTLEPTEPPYDTTPEAPRETPEDPIIALPSYSWDDDTTLLAKEDFSIYCGSTKVGIDRPFSEIAKELGIVLDVEWLMLNSNIFQSMRKDSEYWFTYSYPREEDCEVTIEFYFNANTCDAWLISARFYGKAIETNRGVKRGSTERELLKAYGEAGFVLNLPVFAEEYEERMYYYSKFPDAFNRIFDYAIFFITDIETEKITWIIIDYLYGHTMTLFGMEDDLGVYG